CQLFAHRPTFLNELVFHDPGCIYRVERLAGLACPRSQMGERMCAIRELRRALRCADRTPQPAGSASGLRHEVSDRQDGLLESAQVGQIGRALDPLPIALLVLEVLAPLPSPALDVPV